MPPTTATDLSHTPIVRRLIENFRQRTPMRARSLIITLFGDVVSQHGKTIWLGSLIKALAPFGVNDRLVRTSVFRLVQDGWLRAERVGRRSYYSFTAYGEREYKLAAKLIYSIEQPAWQGHWQLLLPVDVSDEKRENLRRSLNWQGFRSIAPGVFAKPGESDEDMTQILADFDVADKVIVFNASTSELVPEQLLHTMVHQCWKLQNTADAYQEFIGRFRPLLKWLDSGEPLDLQQAFIARVLIIHEYRRIHLQDTPLPQELLPSDWPAAEAEALVGASYKRLAKASQQYITRELECRNGAMPRADREFDRRFPGIE